MSMKPTTPKIVEQRSRATVSGTLTGKPDALPAIQAALAEYFVASYSLENDGYIGIPVDLFLYTKEGAYRQPIEKSRSTRIDDEVEPNNHKLAGEKGIVLYLINLATERIGTDTDEVILRDLLLRGYHVLVLDYHHELRATAPDLDWSIQGLRNRIRETGDFMNGLPFAPSFVYVLPEGYNMKCGIRYFDYAENGVDGIEDFIVDTWNTALHRRSGRFAQGEKHLVYWGQKLDEEGKPLFDENGSPVYKKVTPDAVWEDEEKRIIKVCYTVAEDFRDCVKGNGEPLDMSLYIDLFYPTNPTHTVPVMICHSSSQARNEAQLSPTRPILNGYLFRGYAGVVFDHAYIPMARKDHFGYFEGEIKKGRRMDFTLRFVAGMESLSAMVRTVRKIAELCPEYRLDPNALGGYGHSKAAPMNILATAHPELLPKESYLPGHRGECNKPQPYTHYEDGTPISSSLNLCYTSNGGGGLYLKHDMCPTVVTQGESDGIFNSESHYGAILSTLRSTGTPTLDMSMVGVGHTTIYGYSEERDYDMYSALFDFTDYYLKGAPSTLIYILPIDNSRGVLPTDKIRLKFTGEHTREQIEQGVRITKNQGEQVMGFFTSHFSGNEWTFTPTSLAGGDTVTIEVLPTLRDKRGDLVTRPRAVTFVTRSEREVPVSVLAMPRSEYICTLSRPRRARGERVYLRINSLGASGRMGLYQKGKARPVLTFGMQMNRVFDVDITDIVRGTRKEELSFTLRPMKAKAERTLYHNAFDLGGENPFLTSAAKRYPIEEPDATPPVTTLGRIERTPTGEGYALSLPAGEAALFHGFVPFKKHADLGRCWRIDFDAMSPDGRDVHAKIVCHDCEAAPTYMDFYSDSASLTELPANQWRHVRFFYNPTDENYLNPDHIKSTLKIVATASIGVESDRLYVKNLTLTECQKTDENTDMSIKVIIR